MFQLLLLLLFLSFVRLIVLRLQLTLALDDIINIGLQLFYVLKELIHSDPVC
jgi:hypothetical protein